MFDATSASESQTNFGRFWGSVSNQQLFGATSAYGWCKREVLWGARWLKKAHLVDKKGGTYGIVIQARINALLHT